MSKRERRSHEAAAGKPVGGAGRRRTAFLIMGIAAIVLVAAGGAVLLIQTPWMAAHRGQVVGLLGLVLLVDLLLMPVVAEVSANPRHLSGPGKNPEQGPGPWDLGE